MFGGVIVRRVVALTFSVAGFCIVSGMTTDTGGPPRQGLAGCRLGGDGDREYF